MYAVRLVIEEIVFGTRVIVTNLALNLGRLNEYLQQEYPDRVFDLVNRIRLLSDEETSVFWTVRGFYDAGIKLLEKKDWQEGVKPSYAGVNDGGVFYAIDEVHNFFNSRAWMETGRDVLFYLSQHRKLNDTVLCITQAIENVDKQFRSLSQDYTYLRNLGKEKMGLVALPSMFVRRTFGQPATAGGKPMETGTFKLDVSGLASCYDTAKGVGIHGRAGGDRGEKKRGVHWMAFAIGLPFVLFLLAKFLPGVIGGFWTAPADKAVKRITTEMRQPQPGQPGRQAAPPGDVVGDRVPSITGQADTLREMVNVASEGMNFGPELDQAGKPVVICGMDCISGRWRVLLSDGRIYFAGDGHLTYLDQQSARIDGKLYRLSPVRSVSTPGNNYVSRGPPPQPKPIEFKRRPVGYQGTIQGSAVGW